MYLGAGAVYPTFGIFGATAVSPEKFPSKRAWPLRVFPNITDWCTRVQAAKLAMLTLNVGDDEENGRLDVSGHLVVLRLKISEPGLQ